MGRYKRIRLTLVIAHPFAKNETKSAEHLMRGCPILCKSHDYATFPNEQWVLE